MRRNRRGFALWELLVVFAIIAALAAILFPVFAKAREKARQSSCLSNLKQIILADLQYAQDYNDTLPPLHQTKQSGKIEPVSEFDPLYPYLKNDMVLACPSAGSFSGIRTCAGQSVFTSYGLRWESSGLPLSCIIDPKTYPQLLDLGRQHEIWTTVPPAKFKHKNAPVQCIFTDTGLTAGLSIQHNRGINIAFADGHTKWHSADATLWPAFQSGSVLGPPTALGSGQLKPPPPKIAPKPDAETFYAAGEFTIDLPVGTRYRITHNGLIVTTGEVK
jgi:prepilin-type processing-associated H-X9-DG protein